MCFVSLSSFGGEILIKITGTRREAEGGRSLSGSDSNGFCLPPAGGSHSVSVIRTRRESLRLNIAQASFSNR